MSHIVLPCFFFAFWACSSIFDHHLQDWRDVSKYVSLDWSVLMESKTVRVLVKVQQLQKWATEMEGVEHFVSAQMTSGNQQRGQSDFFCLSSDVATTILEKCGAPAPDPVHYITLLKCACGGSNQVVLDKEVQDFFNGPAGIVTPQEVPPPPQVAKFLRNYQLKGYQWLVNNARNHLGSLLADDMALGKTLQTISLMLYLKKNDLLKKPMLVVVPKGLLPTWQRELEYWAAGDLTVHVFYGDHRRLPATAETLEAAASAPPPKRRRVRAKQHDAVAEAEAAVRIDVVLTAYGTVRSDAEKLSAPKMFAGLVLDEAQQIKNPKTQLSNSLNQIAKEVGPLRVALTGTPVENGLTDLYSIIEFILPGYLSSSKENFQKDFAGRLKLAARKGKTSEDQKALDLLNRLKAPFVLRRSKTDNEIEADLPEKLEKTYVCELGKEQRTADSQTSLEVLELISWKICWQCLEFRLWTKAFLSACFLLIEVLSLQPNLLRRTHGVSPVPLQLLEYQHDKMIQNDIKWYITWYWMLKVGVLHLSYFWTGRFTRRFRSRFGWVVQVSKIAMSALARLWTWCMRWEKFVIILLAWKRNGDHQASKVRSIFHLSLQLMPAGSVQCSIRSWITSWKSRRKRWSFVKVILPLMRSCTKSNNEKICESLDKKHWESRVGPSPSTGRPPNKNEKKIENNSKIEVHI